MPIMILMGNTFFHFKIFRESIINGGGENVPLAGIFLRKLLRFCLSRLAIGSQNRTASGENSRCNKKAHPAFRQDAAQNRLWIFSGKWDKFGTFCPKMACFLQFYIVATAQNQSISFIVGILSGTGLQCFVMLHNRVFTCVPGIHNPSWFAVILVVLLSICCPWKNFAVRRNTQ